MIQVEPITNFDGFGIGVGQGEYFHSQGMNKTLFGMSAKWNISPTVTDATLSGLALINWFSQGNLSGTSYNYGFDASGNLYCAQLGGFPWSLQRQVTSVSSHGNGLIFDQKNRLLYASDQYLGMYDGTTWTDNWKDFTLTTTSFRPMDIYEDWVAIGNVNQVALLNVTDGSFNANGLNLPSGYNIRCIKSAANGILIGANFNNRGALILWTPNYIRSIAPWIWRNANIKSIVPADEGWIVFTANGIYKTNGYSIEPILPKLPDDAMNNPTILNNLLPQGAEIIGNKLLFWGTFITNNRKLAGLYILDLDTNLMEFVRASNGCTYGVTGGAIFYDNNFSLQLSYTTANPNVKFIGQLFNSPPKQAHFISQQLGQGANEKTAEGVKFTLGVETTSSFAPTQMTFDASLKIYNFKRQLYVFAVTNVASTNANLIQVDGSQTQQNKAQVGDEITLLEGVNAGQVRHIIAIANQGTNTETWTLDANLPNNTENTVRMVTSPFRLAHKFSLNSLSQLQELYFNVQDRIKGKKFLVKLVLDNIPSSLVIEVKDGQFIYDDLGERR